jgi:hypothetical protein
MGSFVEIDKPEQGRISFLGEFCDAPLERAFRKKHLREDKRLGFACAAVVLAGSIVFIVNGYFLYGLSTSFLILLVARLANFLASLGLILTLRCFSTATALDRLLMAWGILCSASNLVIIGAQTSGTVGHALLSFGVPLVAYCIVPLPLAKQLLVTVSFSLCAILLVFLNGNDYVLACSLTGGSIIANALGSFASWHRNHRRRQVFFSALRETELCSQLEQALAEIKTLRGLLPICAWCKRIRNEEQAWQSVESYVQSHSHAEFTHDICETCMNEQFQEMETLTLLAKTATCAPL